MTDKGLLIVFSGPSGVGKDTVLNRFLQSHPDCVLSVSATTRIPRPGEKNGRDYFFLSREEFGELAARGEMLEYATYGGNLYGTPKEAVDQQLAMGNNVILEIEVQGALQVRELRPDAVFVFVMPPSWECLKDRLTSRGTESGHSLGLRLEAARTELRHAREYDYILVNDDIDQCCRQFASVIAAAKSTPKHMHAFIEEVLTYA